jgi:hypothetical protein
MVDNRPFELVAVPKAAFLKDTTGKGLDDMALLIAYRDWETDSLSQLYDTQFNRLRCGSNSPTGHVQPSGTTKSR